MKASDENRRRLVHDRLCQARAVVLAAALLVITAASAAGNEPAPMLFLPAGEAEAIFQSASATGGSQLVQLNPLIQMLLHSPSIAMPLQVSMSLGNGGSTQLTLTNRQSPGPNRVVWRGSAGTTAGGCVTLALNGDAAAGSVFLPGAGSYQIQYAGQGRHRVLRAGEVPGSHCGVKPRSAGANVTFAGSSPEPLFTAASSAPEPGAGTNAVLDLLVVYTADARNGAGGTNGMLALIDAAVAEANLAFENSLVNARLQLARSAEIDYAETGDINEDLDRLEDDSESGPLYNVRQLRGQSRADLVCLITETTGGPYGLANQMQEVEVEFGMKAFSVIKREFAIAYQALAHEIGHNLGCQHDRATSPLGGAFDFSHALRFEVDGTLYHTVMAYQPGLPVPYFSNPDVSFLGVPTGIALPATNSADNARTINLSAATASRFDSVMPSGTPPSVFLLSPTNGSTFIAPAVIEMIADAYDEDGQVMEVEFYVNGVQVGRRFQPPFTFSWTNTVPGTYTLLAEARDNAGWEVDGTKTRIIIVPPAPAIVPPECGFAADGMFRVRIKGFDGQGFRLETSTDLANWTTLIMDELVGETLDYLDARTPDNVARYYRVLPTP